MSEMLEALGGAFQMILDIYGSNENYSNFEEWLNYINFQDTWSVDQLLRALNSSFPGIGNDFPEWGLHPSWEQDPVPNKP